MSSSPPHQQAFNQSLNPQSNPPHQQDKPSLLQIFQTTKKHSSFLSFSTVDLHQPAHEDSRSVISSAFLSSLQCAPPLVIPSSPRLPVQRSIPAISRPATLLLRQANPSQICARLPPEHLQSRQHQAVPPAYSRRVSIPPDSALPLLLQARRRRPSPSWLALLLSRSDSRLRSLWPDLLPSSSHLLMAARPFSSSSVSSSAIFHGSTSDSKQPPSALPPLHSSSRIAADLQ